VKTTTKSANTVGGSESVAYLGFGNNNNNNCPTWHEKVLRGDKWRDIECLYKTCQSAMTDGGLFADTGNERGDND